MKEEGSAKQQDVELEKEEVNPINNITNMIINKIIYIHSPAMKEVESARQQDEEMILISMIMIIDIIIINIALT